MKLSKLTMPVLALSMVLYSCQNESSEEVEVIQDEVTSQAESPTNSVEENTEEVGLKFTNGRSNISFNWPQGRYTRDRANRDFRDTGSINNTELNRLSITSGKQLSVKLLKNSTGSNGGQFAQIPIQRSSNSYTLRYNVKFPNNFEFGKGGKIPGLAGGRAYSGCRSEETKRNGDGWSSRVMWTDGGNNRPFFYPYVYYNGMPTRCGDSFNKKYYIQKNKWYTVEMFVKMNTGSSSNGVLRIKVNNQTLIQKNNMKWVTKNAGREIDKFMMGIFRGGNDSSWHVYKDTNILFDNFTLIKG